MIVYARPVRFEEIDAAGIVFFTHYNSWVNEAMEHFLRQGIDGGYVTMTMERDVCFSTVHLTADWRAPLRYGDTANIEITVPKIGTTSTTFHYAFRNATTGAVAVEITQVVVCATLSSLQKTPIPSDIRPHLLAHTV